MSDLQRSTPAFNPGEVNASKVNSGSVNADKANSGEIKSGSQQAQGAEAKQLFSDRATADPAQPNRQLNADPLPTGLRKDI